MNQTEELVQKIIEGLQEKKGKDIVTVDLSDIPGAICDYLVIGTGNTPTQVAALADSVWDYVNRELREKPLSIDAGQKDEWIGMDYGTVIVHIFVPERRAFYNIENLWADAPVTPVPDLD